MHDPARRVRGRKIENLVVMIVVVLFVLCGRPAAAAASESGALADRLIERAGMRRGILAVLGSDGNLAVDLARSSEMLVHVREPNAGAVAELRKQADEAGFGIDRLAVEQGPIDKLPYADNVIDVVIADEVGADRLGSLSVDEILRVLRPEGTAIVGKAGEADGAVEKLKAWAEAGGTERVEACAAPSAPGSSSSSRPWRAPTIGRTGSTAPTTTRSRPTRLIKAPYMTQFLQGPMYIGMPAITTAAGGRTFLATGHIAHHRREWDMLDKLIARNGYNGHGALAARPAGPIPGPPLGLHRHGRHVLHDRRRPLPAAGSRGPAEEKGEIRIPGVEGDWKWMAMQDGVLYVLAGQKGPRRDTIKGDRTFGGWSWADLSVGYYQRPRVPWGFGNTLAAFDVAEKSAPLETRGGRADRLPGDGR